MSISISTSFQLPSPLQQVSHPLFKKYGVELSVKRDDLIHPEVSGNKWRKLVYNIREAELQGKTTILTFGGPYSNHLYATAKACQLLGFRSIGIIRGNYFPQLSSTLEFAQSCGMKLHFVSKSEFDSRLNLGFIEDLENRFGEFYLVPEGGANSFGVQGCSEILTEISSPFDWVATACGTATTLAGLILGLKPGQKALGVSVLKDGGSLEKYVETMILGRQADWEIVHQYAGNGYAKVDESLKKFKPEFENQTGIPLDWVYTAKLFFALTEELKKGRWKPGTKILALHTGGLQGNDGFLP
ncbi:MAG: pyridoxal-phosphate dependent enzyme [Bacteroidia bacterium]|nr:pyridoxal-phosphate dependent enzyme [Bacteroidia bacterium]